MSTDNIADGQSNDQCNNAFFLESKEFFQSVFRSAEMDRGSIRDEIEKVTVEDVVFEGGSNLGDNYGSALVFANVRLRDRKHLRDVGVVIKLLKQTRWHLEMMDIFSLFDKEVDFYNNAIPAIAKFQSERGVRWLITEFVPKCLYAKSVDCEQIVMTENLCQNGFRMADRHRGLGLRHSTVALEALGRFHAASLAMKILEPEAFWEACKIAGEESHFTEERKPFYDRFYSQISRGKVEALVKAEVEKGVEDAELLLRVSGIAENVVKERPQVIRDVLQRYREPLAVINHGDFWVNNIMFRYGKDERGAEVPVSAKFVDFQMTRYASPCIDILTFLYTSTTLQLRKDYEEHLLRAYHDSLLAGIREAGVDIRSLSQCSANEEDTAKFGGPGKADLPDSHLLSYATLKKDLRRHWPWGFLLAEFMLRIVTGDPKEAGNGIETTMTNNTATQDIVDDEEKVVGYEMLKLLTTKAYDERYMEVIRDFAQKGYISDQSNKKCNTKKFFPLKNA